MDKIEEQMEALRKRYYEQYFTEKSEIEKLESEAIEVSPFMKIRVFHVMHQHHPRIYVMHQNHYYLCHAAVLSNRSYHA